LINALQSDSRFRVLSSPSVLASDNRPARIQVGSEEPVATGNITEAVGTVASATTIQYRNTGRIVTIIPQVNSQGLVNLQILAEVSQRGVPVLIGRDFYPAFDIRQAETTAVVQNGDTLVIGGIITDNRSNERSGIPYLMDVPVIGRFFGTTSDTIRRTELIMLITPNVIRNRQEGAAVSEEFKSKVLGLRSELERLKKERERELEKLRKVPPELPKPEPPPVPGVEAPQSESSNRPARPPAGSAPMAPGPRSSDADRQIQPLAPSAGGENTPMATGPNLSAAHLAKAKSEEAADKADSKRGQIWVVQVASFTKEADARLFAGKLKAKGFNPKIVSAAVDGKPRFRVEIGPLESHGDAETVQKELVTIHKIDQAIVLTRWINAGAGPQATAGPVAP
jgi:cell division septation protein DedD